jgi:hypothetical protein
VRGWRTSTGAVLVAVVLAEGAAAAAFDGAGAGDAFGSALAAADMNEDGIPDLVIGAPLADGAGKDAGAVQSRSGADGAVLSSVAGAGAGERFGAALAVVPDQNGDSVPDLVVGAPYADVAATVNGKNVSLRDAGRVSLHSGADGARLAVVAEGARAGDRVGAAVAAGDLAGGGGAELAVGAPGADAAGAKDVGRVIVFADLGGSAVLYAREGSQVGEGFGAALAIEAGSQRLLVGSPGHDALVPTKRKDAGRVQIFAGADGAGAALVALAGEAKGERFGTALASFGADLDGDGEAEIAVGSPGAAAPGAAKPKKGAGRVRVFSDPGAGSALDFFGAAAGDALGAALGAGADFDGDGANDLAIGSPNADVALLANAGRAETHGGVACTMRTGADRPDDAPGAYQLRVWYALPADFEDRRRDLDGSIRTSVDAFTQWMGERAEGRSFRIDRCGGVPDVGFVRFDATDAELRSGDLLHNLGAEMLAAGLLDDPKKMNLLYYEGTNVTCASANFPSQPGQYSLAALSLNGAFLDPNVAPCSAHAVGASLDEPGYLELSLLHEAFHLNGAVPVCAPHASGTHVSDANEDLMYAGSQPWQPDAIDVDRDDYFDTGGEACFDVARSPFLEPLPPDPVAPPFW